MDSLTRRPKNVSRYEQSLLNKSDHRKLSNRGYNFNLEVDNKFNEDLKKQKNAVKGILEEVEEEERYFNKGQRSVVTPKI